MVINFLTITYRLKLKQKKVKGKTITYRLKFIDSFRFMSASVSKLVKYLSGKLHFDNCTDCKSKLD